MNKPRRKRANAVDTLLTPTEQLPELTEQQLAREVAEVYNPEEAGTLPIGGKRVKIVALKMRRERRMMRLIAPYLTRITDATAVGMLDEVLQGLLAMAADDLLKLAALVIVDQPAVHGIDLSSGAASRDEYDEALLGLVEAWVDDHATFEEIADLVVAYAQKTRMADSLGKLWTPGALAVNVLRTLESISKSPATLSSLLNLNLSATATA